jgi:hypothetical protein
MAKITIDNFQRGISSSPHTGFQELRNVELFFPPGEMRAGSKTSLTSSATVDGLVRWFFYDASSGDTYSLADNGDLYRNTGYTGTDDWSLIGGTSTTNANGNGFAVWKGYAFIARDTALDYASLGSITSWTTGWQSLNSDNSHHILISEDDHMYIANGKDLVRLIENTTFDPSNGSTYSWSGSVASIADDVSIKTIRDYTKRYIIAGVEMPGGKAALYFYDRTTLLFEERILLDEYGMGAIVVSGSNFYVQAGQMGTIYVGNIAGVQKLTEMNFLTSASDGLRTPPFARAQLGAADTTASEILFGIGDGTVGSDATPLGVYAIKDQSIYLKNIISTGSDGSGGAVEIGAIAQVGNQNGYFISWKDDSSYGIDSVNVAGSSGKYTNYLPYAISEMYLVAEKKDQYTFQDVAFYLGADLGNDDGIRLEYRTSLTGSWTTIGTWTGSDVGNVSSFFQRCPISQISQIQFRVSLRGDTRVKRVVIE